MKTLLLAALLGAGIVPVAAAPAIAQSAQERLDARYERALAAGYKALFLCSAIANAERRGSKRTPESVHEWELTGIYPALDPIIRDLPYEILRRSGRGTDATPIDHVRVPFSADSPARIALHKPGEGCSIQPIGTPLPDIRPMPERDAPGANATKAWPTAPDRIPESIAAILAASAFDGTYGEGSRTTAALVVKDGAIALERYAEGFDPDTPQRTWSVAKSIAATLVGAAVQRGEIAVSDSAGLGLDARDPRRAISVDDALRMASGRYSDTPGNRTDPLYWGGTSVSERAQNWPLIHEPGSVYRYANNDTLAAVMAISASFEDHPPAALFRALGMNSTIAETDSQGNYVLSSQVWSTARDLAALGQLHLEDGIAPDGTRILPAGWRDYVSTPSGPQPGGAFGYGAGWWLMNTSPGVPSDTFAAFGNRGQYVVVVPSRDVVIVRRGEDMVGTRFDIAAFTRDVLAALD